MNELIVRIAARGDGVTESGRHVPFEGSYGFGRDRVSTGWQKAALRALDDRASRPGLPVHTFTDREPLQPGDTEGLAEIHRAARCPIATGERLIGLDEFAPLIAGRIVDIVQPDLNHCGGLIEAQAIAAAAAAANIGVADWMFVRHTYWVASAVAGVLISVVWNYAMSSLFTWRRR